MNKHCPKCSDFATCVNASCPCHASANAGESEPTDWEERFDELWPGLWTNNQLLGIGECRTQVKAFIKEEIQKAHQKGRYEAIEFYEQKKIPEAEKRVAGKIIDDIPDYDTIKFGKNELHFKQLKQQLRDKYL